METTSTASPTQPHPIRLVVNDDLQPTRLTVSSRTIVAIRALFVTNLLGQPRQLLAVCSWLIALVTGRVPEGLRNFAVLALRFETQTYGYLMLLTGKSPSFNVGIEE